LGSCDEFLLRLLNGYQVSVYRRYLECLVASLDQIFLISDLVAFYHRSFYVRRFLVASSIYFPSFSRYVASIVSNSIGAKLLDFIDKGEISPVLVDCFREILFIAQHFGFFDVCLVTLLNIGYVYSLLGNYDLSMQYYNAVIDFYRQNPKRDYLGVFVRACFNLGELLHRFSRFSSAVNYYMMALEEIARFNASEDLVEDYVDLLVNLGATFYEMGLLRRAYEFYNEAFNFIKTHVDFDSLYLADVIMSTGVIFVYLGLLVDAE